MAALPPSLWPRCCSCGSSRLSGVRRWSIGSTPRLWRSCNPPLSAGTAPNLQLGSAIPGLVGLQGFNRGELLTGAHLLGLTGPGPDYKQAATLEINANDQLILVAGGRSFVLGSRAGTIPGDEKPIPAFAAEPGDTASVTLERNLLGWPAPFTWAMTYLSGPPTTWLRHLYYRLSWEKASGARLNMVWRCEQGYEAINGWHNFGFAELIQVEIQPAPPSHPGPQ